MAFRPLSPEESAENWRACRRYLRRYALALLVPLLALLWFSGYATGILDGSKDCPPVSNRNERNPK